MAYTFTPQGPPPSMNLSNLNAPGFRRAFTNPDLEPTMPPICPSADALMQSRTYTDLDEVTKGLSLPDQLRERLRKGLEDCGKGPDATMNAVSGPLRDLRQETGDPHLVRTVGMRFAAYLGNGLHKSLTQPPPGFSAIPNSRMGGYHMQQGGGYLYWYPGQGVTRQHHEGEPAAGGMKAAPAGQKQAQAIVGQHQGQQPAANQRMTQKVLQQDMQGTQDPNAPKPISEVLGHDPKEFNQLSKVERAHKTAKWADVAGELEQHGPPEQYATDSHEAVQKSVEGHVRQLVQDGTLPPEGAEKLVKMTANMTRLAKEAGVEPHLYADLMARNIAKVGLQESKAEERTLSDHGVRHITVNVEQAHKVLDALKGGGLGVEPMDYLAAAQVMIDHDLGYTIPAIHQGGFAVKDNYHPQASRVLWEQQPEMSKIFGREGWAEMGRLIESHSGSDLDWEGDPLGSAVRMADNTHLFADKMPEVLFDNKKGVELMAKLHLLKKHTGYSKENSAPAGLKEGIDQLKKALMSHIEGRSDIPTKQRQRLIKAANEIMPFTDTFLVSRLAGRSPEFKFDSEKKSMGVRIEHSSVRGAIADVFGADEEDKQFMKMLEDFGIKESDQAKLDSPPPPVKVGVPPTGDAKATFEWQPGKSDNHEAEFADVIRSTKKEYDEIQKLPAEQQQAKMQAWLGELTKARAVVVRI